MKFYDLVQPTLDSACEALFPALSAKVCEGNPSLCRAAVLGFAGDQVRGTLGVATSESGLARVLEHSGAKNDEGYCEVSGPEDALGELANLLLGGIKRTWLRREVSITLATPLVIRGISIEVCGGDAGHWFTLERRNGGERVTAWLDLHCDRTLEIPDSDSSDDLVNQGETLLF